MKQSMEAANSIQDNDRSKTSDQEISKNFIEDDTVKEIFSDSIGIMSFDASHLRIEFCVTRMDRRSQPAAPLQRQLPVCRLVLTLEAIDILQTNLDKIRLSLGISGESAQ